MASQQCQLYDYTPSIPLAVVGIILFSALTAIHLFRLVQDRIWGNPFFVIGGLVQMSGYTARLFSAQDDCNRTAYGVQSVLLILGPTLLMFSVNITQTSFARALNAERYCWLPLKWQLVTYLAINTVLIIIQAIGSIMTVASTSIEIIATGTKISIVLFIVQLLFWLFTLAENLYMAARLRRHPTEASRDRIPTWRRWNQLFGLSISIIATGRNVMRLTMYGGIQFLVINEWPSYAFDGYQMIVVMGAWAIWFLPERCKEIVRKESYIELGRSRRGTEEMRMQNENPFQGWL